MNLEEEPEAKPVLKLFSDSDDGRIVLTFPECLPNPELAKR
jgi:hypothetical protein